MPTRLLRLAAAGVVIAVLAGCPAITSLRYAATADGQSPHWANTTGGENVVHYTIDPTVPDVIHPIIHEKAAAWSAAQYFRFQHGPCPTNGNCLIIIGAPINGGGAGFCSGCTHLPTGPYGATVYLDNSLIELGQMPNVACHELGHVAGPLDHSPYAPGPCQNGWPTPWDLALVDQANIPHGD
jgi:hypothetical protein